MGSSVPWPGDLRHFPWRLIMPTLLHGGLLHIGFNMWVLMDIGGQLEELYGSARYLFIYFFTGIGAYLVSGYFNHGISIGASGSLLGLIGVMLAITTRRDGEHMRMLRSQLVRWLVYLAVLGFVFSGHGQLGARRRTGDGIHRGPHHGRSRAAFPGGRSHRETIGLGDRSGGAGLHRVHRAANVFHGCSNRREMNLRAGVQAARDDDAVVQS